jgi:hypothetical protein
MQQALTLDTVVSMGCSGSATHFVGAATDARSRARCAEMRRALTAIGNDRRIPWHRSAKRFEENPAARSAVEKRRRVQLDW